MQYLVWIFVAWVMMAGVMAALWVLQRRTGDAGIVDVAWGLGVAACGAGFAYASDGLLVRRAAIVMVMVCWAVRLSGYVLKRVLTMREDGRYQQLKQDWGDAVDRKMFAFYQFQAFASVLFALPVLVASQNALPWRWLDSLGLMIGVGAIVGESWADWQLSGFRGNPDNRGQVCRVGLWNYSRHPNYFFEWLHWWAYVCFANLLSWGWLTIAFPMAMLYFILFKTGIPPTEQQALQSRGEAYRKYQQEVSAFVPWPPRQPSAHE